MPTAERPASRRRVYLDTSAYLCILLGEDGAAALSRETESAELVSSVLLVLEARRNLVRLARAGALAEADYRTASERLEDDAGLFVLRDLTLDLCRTGVLPAVVTPRSLDLVHLRTALWFQATEGLDRFLTRDGSQRDAARELGLPV